MHSSELILRLVLLHVERTHAGGFLQQDAAILRPLRQHLIDKTLPDHHALADAGFRQELLDIAQTHSIAVEEVFILAGTIRPPRNADFGQFQGERAVLVVERKHDLRHTAARTPGCARKDDVLALAAPQRQHALLAERPTNGVCQVALAAAVRTDNRGNAPGESQLGPGRECLEAVYLELCEVHRG